MSTDSEQAAAVEAALLDNANIARVIELDIIDRGGELLVCAKLDLPAEATMREVSTILYEAKRRVLEALPQAAGVYLQPEVWVDPEAAAPTTSAVVMLGLD